MPKTKKTSLFHDLRVKLSQDPKHNKELLDFACERECSLVPARNITTQCANIYTVGYDCVAVEDEFVLVKKAQVSMNIDYVTSQKL